MMFEDYRALLMNLSGYVIRVAVAMAIMSVSSLAFALVYFVAVGQAQRDNRQDGEDGFRADTLPRRSIGQTQDRGEDWTSGDAVVKFYPGAEARLRGVSATVGRRAALALLTKGDLNAFDPSVFSDAATVRAAGLLRGPERHKKLKRSLHSAHFLLRFN